jgi:hypothetical protein
MIHRRSQEQCQGDLIPALASTLARTGVAVSSARSSSRCSSSASRAWAVGSASRQRAWLTTAAVCEWLAISRETLRELRLRCVLQPGKHFRRRGCTQRKGPLQWHLKKVEAAITGWSRRHLRA